MCFSFVTWTLMETKCIVISIEILFQLGELGRGAGKGGGGGGSVREAGGAFGKREVAEEERYFRWRPVSSNPLSVLLRPSLTTGSPHLVVGKRRKSRWMRWGSTTPRRLSTTKRRLSACKRRLSVIRAKLEGSSMMTECQSNSNQMLIDLPCYETFWMQTLLIKWNCIWDVFLLVRGYIPYSDLD